MPALDGKVWIAARRMKKSGARALELSNLGLFSSSRVGNCSRCGRALAPAAGQSAEGRGVGRVLNSLAGLHRRTAVGGGANCTLE